MICSFVALHDHLLPEFAHAIVGGLQLVLHSASSSLTSSSLGSDKGDFLKLKSWILETGLRAVLYCF